MKRRVVILRFDFVGSKRVTDTLSDFAGSDGIRGYTDKIGELRDKALETVIQNNQSNNIRVLREEGDGAYVIFDDANHAHKFAQNLHCNEKRWMFRIGAAIGEINEEQGKQPVGRPISDAQRLEAHGAECGGFCIDQATYDALDEDFKQNYSKKDVKGKNYGEKGIVAWHCQMIAKDKLIGLDEHAVITTETGLKLLRLLNYKDPESHFKALIQLQEVAFLIQAPNLTVQNWLTERLIYQVPNSPNARKQTIDFCSCALSSGVENFWLEFKDFLKVENPTCASIIKDLADLCQNKTVIIIMRELNFIDLETIPKILCFWQDLVNEVRSRHNRTVQSRLVLLLIAEPEEYQKFCNIQNQNFNFIKPSDFRIKQILKNKSIQPKDIFLLQSMDRIPKEDVQEWLQKAEVLSAITKGEEPYIEKLLNDVIPRWGEVPENVLRSICKLIFNFTDGIAEIESKWKW
jgi:hypothetical protein